LVEKWGGGGRNWGKKKFQGDEKLGVLHGGENRGGKIKKNPARKKNAFWNKEGAKKGTRGERKMLPAKVRITTEG